MNEYKAEKKTSVSSNLIWRLFERFGAQGVTLIVSIILARILDPVIYGTVALVTVITTILQVFVDGGFGTALIQKENADDIDFSTVFYFNIAVCTLLYTALFFCSPLVAYFFDNDELTSLVRVLGLLLPISAFKNVQHAFVSRNLLFKKYFFATLVGTVIAACVGIYMAYNGYGVWALVIQNIVNQAIDTIVLWILVKWHPKRLFSFKRLKILFSFGWKILLSSLIDTIWNESRQLIIGKKYSKDSLAFYNKGEEYPKYGTSALNTSIDSVLLPVMSQHQDNPESIKELTRKAIKIGSFCCWPIMMGLAVCAKPLISLVLTDKWLPAVPYLQIFCLVYAFLPIHTANLNAIKALGRSDIFLVLEIIKKILNFVLIITFMWFGVIWLAISTIIGSVLGQIINSWPNRKLLNYKYSEQLLDILPYVVLACVMGMVVYSISFFGLANWITLLIQIPLGIIIYIGGAILFKMEPLFYCFKAVKRFFTNN